MKSVNRMSSLVVRLMLVTLLIFWLPVAAHALAIAPGQLESAFYPNEKKGFEFELANNEGRTINVEMLAGGELAKFVSLEQTKLTLRAHESQKIKFTVDFPDNIKLPNAVSIIAKTQARGGGGATLNAYVALEFRLVIKGIQTTAPTGMAAAGIPKAGFVAGDVEIEDVRFDNVGKETAKLIIDVKNSGAADTDVSAEVKFGSGEIARAASVEPVKITGGATRRLVTYVDVRGLPAGDYDAEVAIKYADKIKRQLVKLQIIEAGAGNIAPVYVYIVLGVLIAFNLVFVVLIAGRRRS